MHDGLYATPAADKTVRLIPTPDEVGGKTLIDSEVLAGRLNVPVSWVREQVRCRAMDPLPHFRMGKYVRFDWNSIELQNWISRRLITTAGESKRDKRKQAIQ
jgi:hypothetical protein